MQTAAPAPSPAPPGIGAEAGAVRPQATKGRARLAVEAVHYGALALLTLFILLVSVVPAVMGWAPLTILSGSMAPSMPTGSLAVVAPIDEDSRADIPIGTVITYMPHADSDELVTHRVIMRSTTSDGSVSYIMKGDANEAADPEPVSPKQIRAERKYSLPLAGRLTAIVTPEVKRVGRMLLAGALIAYAALQFVQGLKERRDTAAAAGGDGGVEGSRACGTEEATAGGAGAPTRVTDAPRLVAMGGVGEEKA